MAKRELNASAKNIILGIRGVDADIIDSAANVVEEAESMVRGEMKLLGWDEYPDDVVRRILGAIAAQYQ